MTDYYSKSFKKKVRQFLDSHPDQELSAAKLEYSLYLYQGWPEKIAGEYVRTIRGVSESEQAEKKAISGISSPDEIEKWMRRKLESSDNKQLVRDKMLEHEDEMLERIKKRSLRSLQDEFIENALYFFLHAKGNHSAWILNNLENFNSPYARSMFCLVIGFRGGINAIETMMHEADYFEKYYPDHESYDQGPILAVQELAVRFLNDN